MVPLGLSQAATVRVGLAHGAGDPDGVTRAGWTAFVLGVSLHGADGAGHDAVAASADRRLHRPRRSRQCQGRSGSPSSFLAFAGLFQIFDGAQAVAAGMLRGLHDTKVPMIYAAIGYWGIGLPLGVVLAFRFGFNGVGIWIGLSSGLAVVAALLLARWLRRDRIAPPLAFGH